MVIIHVNNIPQYFNFYCVFDQINEALVSKIVKKKKKKKDRRQTFEQ